MINKTRTTINVEDTAAFCNEFIKLLEYIYFVDPCNENELTVILIFLVRISINRLLYQLITARTHCLDLFKDINITDCNINFDDLTTSDFNEQSTIPTDKSQNALLASF